jgi:hypothetical protein
MVFELSFRSAVLAVAQVALAAIAIGVYFWAAMTRPFPSWLPVAYAFSAVAAGAATVGALLALLCHWRWVALGALFGLLGAATRLQFRATASHAGVFHEATSALTEWHRLLATILVSVTVVSWVTYRLRVARGRRATP